jgi:hypothetical protein
MHIRDSLKSFARSVGNFTGLRPPQAKGSSGSPSFGSEHSALVSRTNNHAVPPRQPGALQGHRPELARRNSESALSNHTSEPLLGHTQPEAGVDELLAAAHAAAWGPHAPTGAAGSQSRPQFPPQRTQSVPASVPTSHYPNRPPPRASTYPMQAPPQNSAPQFSPRPISPQRMSPPQYIAPQRISNLHWTARPQPVEIPAGKYDGHRFTIEMDPVDIAEYKSANRNNPEKLQLTEYLKDQLQSGKPVAVAHGGQRTTLAAMFKEGGHTTFESSPQENARLNQTFNDLAGLGPWKG